MAFGELEVTVLKKEEALPQNRSYFFEEVMGKLKLRDMEADNRPQNTLEKNLHDFTVLHILVSIDQFVDAQLACRHSVVVPCFGRLPLLNLCFFGGRTLLLWALEGDNRS
jgi:hypothetical protein